MQKNVLLIHKGKAFMLGTIAKNFADGGYGVAEAEPTVENLGAHKGEADLFVLYPGDYVDDISAALVYLKDICTEEDKLLILIGTATEIETATRSIPEAVVSVTFERPFDMKKLVAQADWLLSAKYRGDHCDLGCPGADVYCRQYAGSHPAGL